MTIAPFVRDTAVTAVIFGVAAFVWFGWAQEGPPARWRAWLGAGSGAGLLLAAVGGLLTWQNWGPESALAAEGAPLAFGIVCGVEFGLCAIGAAVLGLTGRSPWIATWIAFVVGVHFVPLAFLFQDVGMVVLAVLIVLVSVASVVLVRRGAAPRGPAPHGPASGTGLRGTGLRGTGLRGAALLPSAVVGLGTGAVFLAFSARAALAVALG